MDLAKIPCDGNLGHYLADGNCAADPLLSLDVEVLTVECGYALAASITPGRMRASLRHAILAAYSLGARHALERSQAFAPAPSHGHYPVEGGKS